MQKSTQVKRAAALLTATWIVSAILTNPGTALAQTAAAGGNKLEYVVLLHRHGVRSPLVSLADLGEYSAQPWHPLSVPLGYLTEHGRIEMRMTGEWDREYLLRKGLIAGTPGCGDAAKFYFHADAIQRDLESARAVALTMFPNCNVPIHSSPAGTPDPMFLSADAPGLVDRELAGAAFEGRTGSDPWLILKSHASDVAIAQKILSGNGPAPKKTLLTPVPPKGDRYARAIGPLTPDNYITDALLLEYEEGYPPSETAWGRMNETNLPAVLILQQAFTDLVWDNVPIARARGSNLLAHMLRSMQQEVSGHAVEGALGNPGDAGLVVLGHDSDFGHIATMLNLSWILEGFPPKATPPGAAMMFEIWREESGKRTVRLSIVGQAIQQIRDSVSPVKTPPMKVAVFIPGCSIAAEGFPCDFEAFRKTLEGAIDTSQVRPEPAAVR